MHCIFDGSFDGLMSLVLDTWRVRNEVEAVSEFTGADSLLPTRYFTTDMAKAKRVRDYIQSKLGEEFAWWTRAAFLSRRENRFRAIVKTLHLSIDYGKRVTDLLDDEVLAFVSCHKEVLTESHRFQGLLRFRQMHDHILLARFAPRNNILSLVLPRFMDRFPDEKLMIYDETRHLAGLAAMGRVQFEEMPNIDPQDTLAESEMQDLWRVFFNHLAIKERTNPRLQKQKMPKYTWKNLTEMQ